MNKPVQPMSSLSLKLPKADRSIETYRLAASRTFPAKLEGALNRIAFSAVHTVADPFADNDPWLSVSVDWDKTIACLLYTSPSPRDGLLTRMPSSA